MTAATTALLEGKVAVVTGAGQGIGRGVALQLAQQGARVVVADINAETAAETAAMVQQRGGDAVAIECDIADSASVEALVDEVVARFGALHILINNAYLGNPPGALETKPAEHFARALQGSFYAPLAAMQRAFPHMKAQGFGRIINMCSLNGVNAHMYSADYNVSKEALRCLTRSAAREWAAHGITVNAICPGFFRTKMASGLIDQLGEGKMAAAAPLGRLGDDEDLKGITLLYASDAGKHVTGQWLAVDGGVSVVLGAA